MKKVLTLLMMLFSIIKLNYAQIPAAFDQTLQELSHYNKHFPEEKIYLHLDRSYYSLGDDLWFKAYVTQGSFNTLSQYSKMVYIDLIGPDDKLVQSLKLPLAAGISFGDFHLADTFAVGSYRVRAYTHWMKNFGDEYFFDKTISIQNPQTYGAATAVQRVPADPKAKDVPKAAPMIAVFPEGGQYYYDVPNYVALKVNQVDGQPMVTQGWLKTKKGENLIKVTTGGDGIGSLIFVPYSNESYELHLEDANGQVHTQDLTLTQQNGYRLSVNNQKDSTILIELMIDPNKVQGQDLNLLVHQNGEVFYALKTSAKSTDNVYLIPRKVLGDGINEIVLFSGDMQSLAYRKIFNAPLSRQLPLEVKADKTSYGKRELVKVNFLAGNPNDSLTIGSYSVSVTHDGKVPWDSEKEDNIQSYLLLKSGNKKIDFANRYFKNESMVIDPLLLTLEQSKIGKELTQKKNNFEVENEQKVSGVVTRLNGKTPEPNAKILLYGQKAGIALDTLSDKNGRFNFDRLFFNDSTLFVLHARGEKGRTSLRVLPDEIIRPDIDLRRNIELDLGSLKQYAQNNRDRTAEGIRSGRIKDGYILQDVNISAKRKQVPEHSLNMNGPGHADQIVLAGDLEGCETLSRCLNNMLKGVYFKMGIPFSVRSPEVKLALLVDGMPRHSDDFDDIYPEDVESVEVLTSGLFLEAYHITQTLFPPQTKEGEEYTPPVAGLIIITTKLNKKGRIDTKSGFAIYKPQGIAKIRTFTSPDYSSEDEMPTPPDLRSTIYWKPNLVTDEKGTSSFEFYTSDQPGKYRIILQGIDVNGRLGYQVMEFEVK